MKPATATTVAVAILGSQIFAAPARAAAGPEACQALTAQNLFENITVTSATIQPANAPLGRPAFCEVIASAKPVQGSNITVVIRLPDNWNGKLLGSGGGGWAGNTNLAAPGPGQPAGATPGLVAGYAVVQTNAGHDVKNVWDTTWSSNAEAVTDFSHRAIHVMTELGKAVVTKYYARAAKRAYFEGCSTGGRQALMEVQRYPNDYDGVIAGAPVYTLTVQTMTVVRNQIFGRADAGFTAPQLGKLNKAVLDACDIKDGLIDGIIAEPRFCKFDPRVLECAAGRTEGDCLTPGQVDAVRKVYAGVKSAAGDTVAYPLALGSEGAWARFISTGKPSTEEDFVTGAAGAGLGGLRALVFNNASFNLAGFDPNKDYRTVRDSAFAAGYEAKDPDISAFIGAGGKLLLWHGLLDPGPSPLATVEYFEQVRKVTGAKVKSLSSSARLFVAPGVYHCRGGPGADQFDAVAAIDNWVEHSQAPKTLLATRQDGALSRPLCEYPAWPRYNGKGDPNSADSFSCK
ncbi:MAG TPA: tannase/feruloyl esterase family alpha/beta hydrolase [Steroidobacteraceae bacterium]|nr:tannase/feruloyl esterase family alpha/beta hydrolase [Steroidobacteraceae bacterium]